ncbi:hypothetical protein [Microlunatus sp. Gsoil 973]|uniref:hypothetical protein n=1 Tax=Microlunatus sp. Gsoil 973 TaxID=2672569 RepID=UPI0012B4EF93|nr:hypothetical protein [Microlunatus sp. Gsoil 973]QGN31947.1 hypothetical protein GJV80_03040 [Microlunatus sp. Gsoil 973]
MILGIVAGSVAFLVIVGVIIGVLTNNTSTEASAPISPGTGTPTAHAPQPRPSEPGNDESDAPTSGSTTGGNTGGSGSGSTSGTLTFGDCKLKPSKGWHKKTVKADHGLASVANTDGDVFQAQCIQLDKGTDPSQVLDTWFDQLAKDCADTRKSPAKDVETGVDDLTAAQAQMQCAVSDSQGSSVMGVASAAAVRDDGMTALTTVMFGESSDTAQLSHDFGNMTVSVWASLE